MSVFGDTISAINLNVPLSTALFTVDTRDGLKTDNSGFLKENQNPYDINIYKNQQLFSGAIQRIALTEINMPWFIPNVNAYNNVLYLQSESGETHALGDDNLTNELGEVVPATAIPTGFYTGEELAVAVQASLNVGNGVFGTPSQPLDWTVQYIASTSSNLGALNAKIFIIENFLRGTTTPGINFVVNPRYNQSKGIYSVLQNIVRSDTLATMMGFTYSSPNIFSNTQYGSYASMQYTNYVDIVSSILTKNQNVRDTSTSYFTGSNLLGRIYISGDKIETEDNIVGTRPFHLHYEFNIPKEIKWNPTEFLSSCNIQLRDMYGNLLYFHNNNPQLYAGSGSSGNSSYVQLNMLISEAGSPSGKFTQF